MGGSTHDALTAVKKFPKHEIEKLGRSADAVVVDSQQYELVQGLLYRRVYDPEDDEVQQRAAAPTTSTKSMELPGQGEHPLGVREYLFLQYHNSMLGGLAIHDF